jgi:hypothetical protein
MANKTADQCIEYILKNIDKRKDVDYGSRLSVRRFNAAYDRILENARYIDRHYPNALGSLMELIYHQDIFVVEHCAPIILALDHESEELLDYMVKYCPACNISRIVDSGIKHIQPGTRWQIAELIYRRKLFDYMHCVRQLCNDKNHYVSKRALNLVRIFG